MSVGDDWLEVLMQFDCILSQQSEGKLSIQLEHELKNMTYSS